MNGQVVLVVHNIRSCHNVGSLLRTADGLGVSEVWMTGYTPYPSGPKDTRLPHISAKITKQIKKTSLGAEDSVNWHREQDIKPVIAKLKKRGYTIVALEQTPASINLSEYTSPPKVALIVGNEIEGLPDNVQKLADVIVEIPLLGKKESLNVASAAAIALYKLSHQA